MLSPFTIWSKTKRQRDPEPDQSKLPFTEKPTEHLSDRKTKKDISSRRDERTASEIITGKTNNNNQNMITTEQIKELRDRTGVSVMQCKKALEESGGSMEKALVLLRKKSGEISAKKGERKFGAGTIQAYIHANGSVGAMVELNCETDFVANNDEFKALARDIAMHVAAANPKFVSKDDITEKDKQTAKDAFEAEVKGKPEAVRQKILDGKLDAYFSEMVLLDQPFIKNPDVKIQGLVDAAVQKFGEKTAVGRFARFKVLG